MSEQINEGAIQFIVFQTLYLCVQVHESKVFEDDAAFSMSLLCILYLLGNKLTTKTRHTLTLVF